MNVFFCRSGLTFLPTLVLVKILRYISIYELLTTVNRTCRTFYELVRQTSVLWEYFEFEHDQHVSIKKRHLEIILKHSQAFRTLIFPPLELECYGYELDLLFASFMKSRKLYHLSLVDLPISTLCFVENTPNIEILNLSGCVNLVNDDFLVLKGATRLDQLYLSFTNISGETLCEIVRGKSLIVLDVSGVPLSLDLCHRVLRLLASTLVAFHLSLEGGVQEMQFNREICDLYLDTSFHIYKQ